MGASVEEAEAWLEAVLDTLSGAYSAKDAAGDAAPEGADTETDARTTGAAQKALRVNTAAVVAPSTRSMTTRSGRPGYLMPAAAAPRRMPSMGNMSLGGDSPTAMASRGAAQAERP